jgi:hypothetical protein
MSGFGFEPGFAVPVATAEVADPKPRYALLNQM